VTDVAGGVGGETGTEKGGYAPHVELDEGTWRAIGE
jgi:hypothetical protein